MKKNLVWNWINLQHCNFKADYIPSILESGKTVDNHFAIANV